MTPRSCRGRSAQPRPPARGPERCSCGRLPRQVRRGPRSCWVQGRLGARSSQQRVDRHRREEQREIEQREVEEQCCPAWRRFAAQCEREPEECAAEEERRAEIEEAERPPD